MASRRPGSPITSFGQRSRTTGWRRASNARISSASAATISSSPPSASRKAGKAVISFSLVGQDHYPSAAYASLDAAHGVGKIHVAAEGLGPIDGFSGYKAFGEPVLQRFGDYGAAVADGDTIWTATEYVGQRCTLKQYVKDTERSPIFTCGRTRSAFGNWYTRISKVRP